MIVFLKDVCGVFKPAFIKCDILSIKLMSKIMLFLFSNIFTDKFHVEQNSTPFKFINRLLFDLFTKEIVPIYFSCLGECCITILQQKCFGDHQTSPDSPSACVWVIITVLSLWSADCVMDKPGCSCVCWEPGWACLKRTWRNCRAPSHFCAACLPCWTQSGWRYWRRSILPGMCYPPHTAEAPAPWSGPQR